MAWVICEGDCRRFSHAIATKTIIDEYNLDVQAFYSERMEIHSGCDNVDSHCGLGLIRIQTLIGIGITLSRVML